MKTVEEASLRQVLGALPGRPRVVASGNFAPPRGLIDILDGSREEYVLHMLNAQDALPDREGVTLESAFVGAGMRSSPRLHYIPCRLSLVPVLLHRTLPPDVVMIHVSPPKDGAVSLGVEVNILPAAIEAVRERGGLVVAQVNPQMPRTYGDALVPVDLIDYAIERETEMRSPSSIPIADDARAIGARVAERVEDGATLQTGIGAIPDAVLLGLQDRRDLRIWTEMFSDGVLRLEEQGVLAQDVPITASFLFGSPGLYAWVDENPRITMLRTEKTNDPGLISQKQAMVSVNTALQVDLFAQANANRIGREIYSGVGGQTDFIVGAMHAPRGQALLALRSWHPKADVSTIVAMVDEPVTSSQVTAIVTEQGTAELFGYDQRTQARHLIEHAAHPRAREDLWEEAYALGLA